MSQWGKRQKKNLVGTFIANLNNKAVFCSTGSLTAPNVVPGDAIVFPISNVEYRVESIVSNTQLRLDVVYEGANASGLSAYITESPKDLTSLGWTANASYTFPVSKRNVYGVNRLEVANAGNKANGISHTGWVHYKSYVDAFGSVRNKSEVLVAMSKNFDANATGDLFVDDNDDLIVKGGGGPGIEP